MFPILPAFHRTYLPICLFCGLSTHQFAFSFYQLPYLNVTTCYLLVTCQSCIFDWPKKYYNGLHSWFDCNTFCRNIKFDLMTNSARTRTWTCWELMPIHLINIRDSVHQVSVPLDYQILALNRTCVSVKLCHKRYISLFQQVQAYEDALKQQRLSGWVSMSVAYSNGSILPNLLQISYISKIFMFLSFCYKFGIQQHIY